MSVLTPVLTPTPAPSREISHAGHLSRTAQGSGRRGAASLLLSALALLAGAGVQARDGYDFARVVDAQPVFREVRVSEPREVCWEEPVRYVERGHRVRHGGGDAGAAVLGGLIGGVLGNQIGSGDGRRAATAAGVLIGAAIGADQGRAQRYDRHGRYDRYDRYPRREVVRHEQVCEWRDDYRVEQELVGYDVTYEYNGVVGHTRTLQPPGREIRVRVSVDPVGY